MSHIAKSSLIIAVFFGLDKVLGLARQVLIARLFDIHALDAFNAANNIPDLLSTLISGGALGVALIPVLSDYLISKGRGEAWSLFARIINLAFLITGALALAAAVFAPLIIGRVVAPGFDLEKQALTVELMRLNLFSLMIFSISGLFMAGLQANQHFLLPALAPALYNIGQIFGLLVFSPDEAITLGPVTLPALGLGIHGAVYGVVLGAVLHLGIQVPGLRKFGFRWSPGLGLGTPGVRQVLALLGPRVLTMFFIQMYFIARDALASGLEEGAVTALTYGWFIMQVPETLIGTAIAIALLPTLAEYAARGQTEAFRDTINRAIQTLVALTIPAAAVLAAGLRPLVAVLGFDEAVSRMVVLATQAYLLGLTGHSLLEIAARSFYARQDARTPVWAAAFNAGLYYLLALWLGSAIGPAGLALANSAAFTLEAALLFWLLRRKVPGVFQVRPILPRVGAAAAAGGLVTGGLLALLPWAAWGALPAAAAGAGALLAGAAVGIIFVWPEVRALNRL